MDSLWIETFKYHRWANQHLLEQCGRLSDEQLQLTAPGTYGTIAGTWMHLAAAEQRYVKRLGGGEPTLNERAECPGMATVTEQLRRSDDELIELAGSTKPDQTTEARWEEGPVQLPLRIVLIQALHHGNDHRTHICTVLGHHGLEYGEMDVWAYGDATGAVVHLNKA